MKLVKKLLLFSLLLSISYPALFSCSSGVVEGIVENPKPPVSENSETASDAPSESGESEPATEAVTEAATEAVTETEPASQAPETPAEEEGLETFLGQKWRLTFEDTFDKQRIDVRKWSYTPEWERDTCLWHRDGVSFRDGCLVLSVLDGDQPYKAGAIRTLGKFKQAYGYYEIRCTLPTIAGVNVSFWLMSETMGSAGVKGGTDGVEIDIMETQGFSVGEIQHAVHWDGYGDEHEQSYKKLAPKDIYDGQFHTFALKWDKDSYTFYVDGKPTWKTDAGGICEVPVYLKLTVATGGWVGDVNPDELPTDAMIVDYVRVYEAVE